MKGTGAGDVCFLLWFLVCHRWHSLCKNSSSYNLQLIHPLFECLQKGKKKSQANHLSETPCKEQSLHRVEIYTRNPIEFF